MITDCGLAPVNSYVKTRVVFDVQLFLAAVLEVAGTQAAIGRVLDLPSSRVTETFTGGRQLKLTEAVKLAEEFGVPLHGPMISAETLLPILRVCLRSPPKGGWTDQALLRLSEEIEFGLGLLRTSAPQRPSQDALDVAARAIADRLRDKPGPEAL